MGFRHDSMVCLTEGKGAGGANQRVESYIVNGHSSLNKSRRLAPQNNTFSGPSHTEKTKKAVNEKFAGEAGMQDSISPAAAILDESDSFCCDANSQLLGMLLKDNNITSYFNISFIILRSQLN